jgi:hypothetical protein
MAKITTNTGHLSVHLEPGDGSESFEASTLGLPPGRVPTSVILDKVVYTYNRFLGQRDDVRGWEYCDGNRKTLIIWND